MGEINQCGGCMRGLPIVNGLHRGPTSWDGEACTKDRYQPSPTTAEPLTAEQEAEIRAEHHPHAVHVKTAPCMTCDVLSALDVERAAHEATRASFREKVIVSATSTEGTVGGLGAELLILARERDAALTAQATTEESLRRVRWSCGHIAESYVQQCVACRDLDCERLTAVTAERDELRGWYDEGQRAANEAGFGPGSNADAIRCFVSERDVATALVERLGTWLREIKRIAEAQSAALRFRMEVVSRCDAALDASSDLSPLLALREAERRVVEAAVRVDHAMLKDMAECGCPLCMDQDGAIHAAEGCPFTSLHAALDALTAAQRRTTDGR